MITDAIKSHTSEALQRWFSDVSDWDDAVLPAYLGGSIANLPATILRGFDPECGAEDLLPPLAPEILDYRKLSGSRVIILLILDGLGRLQLDDAAARGGLRWLHSPHISETITSTTPSTTAAALTSLQMGIGPGVHGLAGYTLYLRELRSVFNMISWHVVGGRKSHAIPTPKGFVEATNIYQRLAHLDVDAVHVSRAAFENSALTQIQATGSRFRGHRTLAELARHLVRQVERDDVRRFVFAYWDGFDALGHSYGPNSAAARLELRLIDQAIGEGVIAPLSKLGQPVTLIITADHGHIPEPHSAKINIDAKHNVSNLLRHGTTGEARVMGFAFRNPDEGRMQLREDLEDNALVLDAAAAFEAGLYGPGKSHPKLLSRVGDTLAFARGDTTFSSRTYNSGSVGGHGSLSAGEMLTPLLVWTWGTDAS